MVGNGSVLTFIISLGLYGWISSPFEHDMDSNIGLHDSKTAIEWTKKYISKFGGDPERITAVGESAGATILTFMLTGDGGTGELPFSQVGSSSFLCSSKLSWHTQS